jgi:hypothetical protein
MQKKSGPKCGEIFIFNNIQYIFLGYCFNEKYGMFADIYGNKHKRKLL